MRPEAASIVADCRKSDASEKERQKKPNQFDAPISIYRGAAGFANAAAYG